MSIFGPRRVDSNSQKRSIGGINQALQVGNLRKAETPRNVRTIALCTHHRDETGILPLADEVRKLLSPPPVRIVFILEHSGSGIKDIPVLGLNCLMEASMLKMRLCTVESRESEWRQWYEFLNGSRSAFSRMANAQVREIWGELEQGPNPFLLGRLQKYKPFFGAIARFASEFQQAGSQLKYINEKQISEGDPIWQEKQFQAWVKHEKYNLMVLESMQLFWEGEYKRANSLARQGYQLLCRSDFERDEVLLEGIKSILRQYNDAKVIIPRGANHLSFFRRLAECGEDSLVVHHPVYGKDSLPNTETEIVARMLEGKSVEDRLVAEDAVQHYLSAYVLGLPGQRMDRCETDANIRSFTRGLKLSSMITLFDKARKESAKTVGEIDNVALFARTFYERHKNDLPKVLSEYFSAFNSP